MKQWRVGTLSMGVALILLGVMLFLTQWRGIATVDTFLQWWPVIFILLGLELLVYLVISRSQNPVVKYDVFSILFVGVICFVCIGFVTVASTGLLEEIRYQVRSVEQTVKLPNIKEQVQATVTRVVVQNEGWSEVLVDRSLQSEQAVHVFGSYRYSTSDEGNKLEPSDSYAHVQTIGDTIYVNIAQPPRRNGLGSSSHTMKVTVVIPEQLSAEIIGSHTIL